MPSTTGFDMTPEIYFLLGGVLEQVIHCNHQAAKVGMRNRSIQFMLIAQYLGSNDLFMESEFSVISASDVETSSQRGPKGRPLLSAKLVIRL